MRLVTGGMTFSALCMVAGPLLGAVNQCDIKSLRAMLSEMEFISKLVNVQLTFMRELHD